MRILFVTYCFGSVDGQALIGVYKRGLRLAMEMQRRGHEIFFFCTGREAYQDALTRLAEERMTFVDIPFTVAAFEEARRNRAVFHREIGRMRPDLIVIGEAPLAGAMLESTLVGAELGVPVVVLDNAYCDLFVHLFAQRVGPMLDGMVLMGPSSHHLEPSPPFLCQVPPFMRSSADRARDLVREAGLDSERLAVVLGYDGKVEALGRSLAPELGTAGAHVLICARDPEACRGRLGDQAVAGRIAVVAQPEEDVLIGLLEVARLAIVKYGFMQVAECLTLRTPVIVVYHEGPTWVDYLPPGSKQFVWVTSSASRDGQTVAAAKRFLAQDPEAMRDVHQGPLTAIAQTAEFLERLPRESRADTTREVEDLGFTVDRVRQALERRGEPAKPIVRRLRALRLRSQPDHEIFELLVFLAAPNRVVRLWARLYHSVEAARADLARATESETLRRILFTSVEDCVLIEEDLGEALLPELNP